jgi:hypothetical protein
MTFVASQSAPARIQEHVASFDRTRAQHDLTGLCAPALAGRRIGTAGHERAHQWLARAQWDCYWPGYRGAGLSCQAGDGIVAYPAACTCRPRGSGVEPDRCTGAGQRIDQTYVRFWHTHLIMGAVG